MSEDAAREGESLRRGLAQAARGETVSRGSFAEFAGPPATPPVEEAPTEFHCDICGSDTHDAPACDPLPVRVPPGWFVAARPVSGDTEGLQEQTIKTLCQHLTDGACDAGTSGDCGHCDCFGQIPDKARQIIRDVVQPLLDQAAEETVAAGRAARVSVERTLHSMSAELHRLEVFLRAAESQRDAARAERDRYRAAVEAVEALDLHDLAAYVLTDAPDADLWTVVKNLARWLREATALASTTERSDDEGQPCPRYEDGKHRKIPATHLDCRCGYRGPYNPDRFA